MTDLPFKRLSLENCLERDPVLGLFATIDGEGGARPVSDTELLELILAPKLASAVPSDVLGVYEAARASMCYGYFFYPLYTFATQQLFRVAEAAVMHRCRVSEAPAGVSGLGRESIF